MDEGPALLQAVSFVHAAAAAVFQGTFDLHASVVQRAYVSLGPAQNRHARQVRRQAGGERWLAALCWSFMQFAAASALLMPSSSSCCAAAPFGNIVPSTHHLPFDLQTHTHGSDMLAATLLQVMGLMQGKVQGDTFIVIDSFALPVEGTETRVNAASEANEYMVSFLDANKVSVWLSWPLAMELLEAVRLGSLQQQLTASQTCWTMLSLQPVVRTAAYVKAVLHNLLLC
jgi:hypothetical protein